MELLYGVKDKPSPGKIVVFALQQLLSILSGTVAVPLIVGNGMSQSAALFGASIGTLVYLLITRFKSPVFLGSSFTYLGPMSAAFAGAASAAMGYVGVIIGAALAGLVYVILSIVVHFVGSAWVDKVMPPIIVGPVVVIIALVLSPNAVANLQLGNVVVDGVVTANKYLCIFIGLSVLLVIVLASVRGKGMIKLTPFVFAILAGYLIALFFTLVGNATGRNDLRIIDFAPFNNIKWVPDFAFLKAFEASKDFASPIQFWRYFSLIFVSYVPVAFAVFAEHIADHKNVSFIIETDLLKDPGLSKTLMGDGLGSMVGAFFGGCPNTTYGESISCLAFSKNASVITIVVTCFLGIATSFLGPVMTFLSTIPSCVVGGLSIALYGFIAISGFQILKKVDLNISKNIFVVATIFVFGIGGLTISFEYFEFSPVATALVIGILMNLIVNISFKPKKKKDAIDIASNEDVPDKNNNKEDAI